ncbi:MAG TPA: lipase maturation factor family protein [Candidatus Limnocylindria bacterium]|nr:lipase maturation factor family protein [Candidatus Limnocylindria bacterium]
MDWLAAHDYDLARLLFQRGLALVYLVAFLVAALQFRPLLGERGLLPAPAYLAAVPFRSAPSLFHLRYSDRLLLAVAWTGVLLALAAAAGLTDLVPLPLAMLVWLALWALYLSIVNIGQTFYSFGWETLLLEAGFLAIFLGNASVPTPLPFVVLVRWLLFRVEFGAGLIKMRGDPCWRDLTCLYYHHETQPMPNPLSWHFHHLPKRFHRLEVLGNHAAQLVVPFLLFFPQPVASFAGLFIVVTQSWLLLSGNFSWLNLITVVLAAMAFDDATLGLVPPFAQAAASVSVPLGSIPLWYGVLVLAVTGVVAVLSYRPARNLVSRRQLMNSSFDPLHLVNTYGAFGSITRERFEIVIEGTDEAVLTHTTRWREYGFKGKPGDVRRRPPQVAPYHLRLDWLMWFAAMSSPAYHEWFLPLLLRLLEADRTTLRLLRDDPFGGARPRYVRALLYRYRFTTPAERRATRAWWSRELVGEYVRPLTLSRLGGR